MKNNYNVLFLILLSFFCSNVFANSYKIEILVFSQNMPSTEVFEQTESKINWPDRVADRSEYTRVNTSLRSSYTKLSGSEQYQPVMHVAWVQSVGRNRHSRAVRISNPEGTINGFFQLKRGQLIHMITDLEYSEGGVIHRINDKRRFKLKDTHYLDHPKFGMLIRVSPY